MLHTKDKQNYFYVRLDSMFYSRRLARFLDRWPGKKRFGIYRFLPVYFILGAMLEFSMINWRVGEANFYGVYKRKQAQKIALEQLREELEMEKNSDETKTVNS